MAMLGGAPDALRRSLLGDGDELFSVDDAEGERQTYNLAKRRFVVGGEAMVLVLVKNLSRELHRQEADAWKRMIRVFVHELNNSLAPISSLVHTGKLVTEGSPLAPKLDKIFGTIAERTGNKFGLTGLVPKAKIIPVRVLDAQGFGTARDIAKGIRFAAKRGADVINMSFEFAAGVNSCNKIKSVCAAIKFAKKRGAVVAAAAGNSNTARWSRLYSRHKPLRSNQSTLSRVADFPANTNSAPPSTGS